MENQKTNVQIEVKKNGPLRVIAEKMEIDVQGEKIMKESAVSFCRCGKSQKQPFCDGSHKEAEPFE
ncbi:MAG: CDGSH iron-sulfur domain-containing protein [Chitinophagales bacterium]|jgi:CDGSH-type Zn-finger protein|nr:CDGSH iron-sulfur domain-containing protein [Sphingobacteriales bacterium]